MPEPEFYHAVKVQIGDEAETATFYTLSDGSCDLLYGFAEYTTGISSSLDEAIENLRGRLLKKHPDETVTIGKPCLISKQQAEQKSHYPKPSASS